MPRMFDILRNKDSSPGGKNTAGTRAETAAKDAAKAAAKKEEVPPLSFPKTILSFLTEQNIREEEGAAAAKKAPGPPPEEKKSEDHSLMSRKLIAEVKKHGVDNQAKAEETYNNAVDVVRTMLEKIRAGENLGPYMDRVHSLLDDVFNQLVLGDSMLENIYDRETNNYHLPYHIVNVLLLSSLIGLNMGFNKSKLSHLGLACVFYDVGLDAFNEITSKPRKLNSYEYDLVRTHISKSLRVVEKISLVNDVIKETIWMHHERVSGEGYPDGIGAAAIGSYAKIIGLADTYEALTNNRPHRQGMDAHRAVRFILGTLRAHFDPDAMKVFINKMSVYPIGSIVRLSTQELARVVSVQPGSPLRPVVMIIWDSFGKPVQKRTIVDLSKQDYPTIQDQV